MPNWQNMRTILASAILCLVTTACRSPQQQGRPEPTTPDDQGQRERAIAARQAMFEALSGRLQEVMKASGPAQAVDVCAKEAPRFAQDVSSQHGVRIGRTSFRLRNPNNQPPAWAQQMVADRTSTDTFVELPGGTLGALLPIRLGKLCERCHGDADSLDPAVSEALARHYPADQATGFREGDLRGWFWVEVPPR